MTSIRDLQGGKKKELLNHCSSIIVGVYRVRGQKVWGVVEKNFPLSDGIN